ncbi:MULTISPECIES: fructose PTS transporter subunit IIA [Enterobacter]|uniref:fructose PTS transporter subunit IIA n=1 Tax=Enterobacter TaxID=547 RepID=UPI001260C5BD|nr:fructose PTS transporter subunit IIA [Enterobacter oligotrophicus]ELW1647737.1 PTS sugar transporter subunit IIA [Enterobacter oligotrophicus]MBT9427544.1 fructose PTS transporter subunit IIA [Enterobacter oligotrophicus]
MNLLALTHPELIFINPPARSPESLIRLMSEALFRQKVIDDKAAFVQSVLHRENEGPTALGEELAVPHGKSSAVRQAAFCMALFDEPVMWPGLEGDEPVRIVFLLAIPEAEAGTTHMQLLTTLTCTLMEESVRANLVAARTGEEALAVLQPAKAHPDADVKPARTMLIPLLLGIITAIAFVNAGLSWAAGS